MRRSNVSRPVKSTNYPFFPAELVERMSQDPHLTGKAERTHAGYLRAVRQLSEFCKTAPDKITEDQVRHFFLHLKNDPEYAYGSLRVALSGVKFFYSVTCKRPWNIFSMLKLQNIHTLPEVITIEQVHRIIDTATTLRMIYWMASAHASTAKPSKCPRPKCPHCRGAMEVKEMVFHPVWFDELNRCQPARPPPILCPG